VDNVLGIEAVAAGAFVRVQAVFTAEGAAELMALVADRLAGGISEPLALDEHFSSQLRR